MKNIQITQLPAGRWRVEYNDTVGQTLCSLFDALEDACWFVEIELLG